MKATQKPNLLFELTHSGDTQLMRDLHDYFDGMYFAN